MKDKLTSEEVFFPKKCQSKKPTRAAVKRHVHALQEKYSSPAEPLGVELELLLANWFPSPEVAQAEEWGDIRNTVHEVMRRSHIRGPESFKKHLRLITKFVGWCHLRGYDMSVSELFRSNVIDDYVLHTVASSARSTRATVRSQLRAIGRVVSLSPEAPVPTKAFGRMDAKPPYEADEVKRILLRAELVKGPNHPRVKTLLALGLGAGLDTRDIRGLHRSDIIDMGDEGIRINVASGGRERTVWLRKEYEELLRQGIKQLRPSQHVLGNLKMHKDMVVNTFEVIQPVGKGERVQQSRLRNTWLATLMMEPIPLWTILKAAGLEGARTLSEIAQCIAKTSAINCDGGRDS